jgi:hypothetical protein
MTSFRFRAVAVASALVLAVAGCSSSGGGSGAPSTSQLEGKLRHDPMLTQLASRYHISSSKLGTVVRCAAQAMKKDLTTSELKSYVDGKTSLAKLEACPKARKAIADAQACAQKALSSG